MQKKILFVITKSNFGGAQRYVFDLANAFQRRFKVLVALGGTGASDAAPGLLQKKLAEAGVPSVFIRSFMRNISIVKEFSALKELYLLFRKEKPDIVHLNSSKAAGLGALAARLSGVRKIIYTVHGLPILEDRNWLLKILIRTATWFTFALSHEIITVSSRDFETAGSFGFQKKIHLIHNGLGPIELLDRRQARKELSLPDNMLIIGTIAEFTKNKGLEYLIEAFSIFQGKNPNAGLCLIGDGELREPLKTKISSLGINNVYLPGYVKDASRLLKAFDVFILSSIKEGLPYVILEAGLASLPVLTSDVGGIPDMIENGRSGFIVPKKDPIALAESLSVLKSGKEREQLGENLHERVSKEFSFDKMLSETEKLYLN